ncbi:hypothetical protein [Sorangium sp. So ce233]|uniref:hypothetical protein n=1 Tax=Sorangium sp. So ce233 TaxID=3133290 RepID=UPI003F61CCE1
MIDVFTALLDGGELRFYDGSRPATPETAISTQELLVTLDFNADAFTAAASASATANAIVAGTVVTQGTAAWARAVTSGGTAVADLTVTAAGGGGDIEFPGLLWDVGAEISISSFTISQPIGS